MADKKVAEQYYSPPPKLGKWEGFKMFLWNGETSQCLGRTGSSWAKIIFFYIVFYSALAGFFAAMLAVFFQTLSDDRPKWIQGDGLIGSNPGLGFRPMPPDVNVESTLIWYDISKPDNTKPWIDGLNSFLKAYEENNRKHKDNIVPCDFNNRAENGNVCKVDFENFGACTNKTGFNFNRGSPCIFLKLNKIYEWVPSLFNKTDNIPSNMPSDLVSHIKHELDRGELNANVIWVSCEGENPNDVESIGSINYIPRRGFPEYYFPFLNQRGYMPPLVAVHFEQPKTGVLINIECKAWARNIHHDRSERRGSVHFELMID